MVKAFNVDAFIEGDAYTATWVLFLLYGTSVVPFCYVLSFIFKKHGGASGAMFNFLFLTGFLGVIIIFVFTLFDITKDYLDIAYVLRLIPTYAFGEGLIRMGSRK